jgi:hypothetical protein
MKYKFIGKPDKIFPDLVTGKMYDLTIDIIENGSPVIISPIYCPYESWESFRKNWELTGSKAESA